MLTSFSFSDEPPNHAAITEPSSRGRTVEAWQESVIFSVNIHSFSAETIIFLGSVSTSTGVLSVFGGVTVELPPAEGFAVPAGLMIMLLFLSAGAGEAVLPPFSAGAAVSDGAVVSSFAGAAMTSETVSAAVVPSAAVVSPFPSEEQAAQDKIIRAAIAKAKNLFIPQISIESLFCFPVIQCLEAADIHYLRRANGSTDRQPSLHL